jgi:molecular chaperone DnaJ
MVPAGVSDGEMIRMPGMGEMAPHGTAGDLYIKLHVKADKTFTRDGFNLHTTAHIKLTEALVGTKVSIVSFDGTETLEIPAGTNHADVLRIKGRGVPHGRNRGDIVVRVSIDMPKKLSRTARDLIDKLKNEGV